MTENEAKHWLKHTRAYQHKCDNCEYIDINGACNEECKDFYDMAIQALVDIQQYRAIGTIEEFKDLKEKSVAKKPTCVSMAKDKDTAVGNIGRCPCCNYIVAEDMLWCDDCGQKLDWSE